jgi:hypothetical protein
MIGARMNRIIIQGILIVVGRQDTGELEAQSALASRNRCDSLRENFFGLRCGNEWR